MTAEPEKPKFCVDCRHMTRPPFSVAMCEGKKFYVLVTGDPYFLSPDAMRSTEHCGFAAILFEAKE